MRGAFRFDRPGRLEGRLLERRGERGRRAADRSRRRGVLAVWTRPGALRAARRRSGRARRRSWRLDAFRPVGRAARTRFGLGAGRLRRISRRPRSERRRPREARRAGVGRDRVRACWGSPAPLSRCRSSATSPAGPSHTATDDDRLRDLAAQRSLWRAPACWRRARAAGLDLATAYARLTVLSSRRIALIRLGMAATIAICAVCLARPVSWTSGKRSISRSRSAWRSSRPRSHGAVAPLAGVPAGAPSAALAAGRGDARGAGTGTTSTRRRAPSSGTTRSSVAAASSGRGPARRPDRPGPAAAHLRRAFRSFVDLPLDPLD